MRGLSIQCRTGSHAERLGHRDERTVVIDIAMIFDNEVITVQFFVIAQITDVVPDDIIWKRILVPARVSSGRIVNQFELIKCSASAISCFNEFILMSRREDGRASMGVRWRN